MSRSTADAMNDAFGPDRGENGQMDLGQTGGPAPATAPANLARVAEKPPAEIVARGSAKTEVPIQGGVMTPNSFEGLWRLAHVVFQSGLVPKGAERVEQVVIAMAAGMEIGLSPMQSIRNVMVVNKVPSVWGDAALALVQASGDLEDIAETLEGEGEKRVARCTVKRANRPTATVRTFSVADAQTAGLWGKQGPWKQYPGRMLQMRARAFALRDAFPDKLMGIGIYEETADIQNPDEQNRAKAADMTNRIKHLDDEPETVNGQAEVVGSK